MKRQTSKQKVTAVFPNAFVVQDADSGKGLYLSNWANEASFAVGYFNKTIDIPTDSTGVYLISYDRIIDDPNFNFISGWQPTKTGAWKTAWKSINIEMMKKFEQ